MKAKSRTYTVTLTLEITTNKNIIEIDRHIKDTQDEIAGMLDQDLNDATSLVKVCFAYA